MTKPLDTWQRYRKRPVMVMAILYTHQEQEIEGFCRNERCPLPPPHLHTLEGMLIPSVGDYIIRGIAGETYPCRADIFAKTYDAD